MKLQLWISLPYKSHERVALDRPLRFWTVVSDGLVDSGDRAWSNAEVAAMRCGKA